MTRELLTWDNMEEVIATLPRDENGRFIINHPEPVLSTDRDSWALDFAEKHAPVMAEKVHQLINDSDLTPDEDVMVERFKTAVNVTYGNNIADFAEAIVNAALDDGLIANLTDWEETHIYGDNPIHLVGKNDTIIVSLKPTNDPKEGVLKWSGNKCYFIVNHDVKLTVAPTFKESLLKVLESPSGNKIDLEAAELQNDPLLRAKRSLESLDTTEAEKEFEAQARANEQKKALRESGLDAIKDSPLNLPDMTPEQLKAWQEKNIEQAKGIIATMDAHLEAGGRVNVADKNLMNCKADLNQLIPFKYNWSWSLYLTSCGNHWMPAEMELDRCVAEYANLPTVVKALVARAYMTHLSRKRLFPESVLMNIYRMLTNPECRQYLLRQGMESVTVSHAWMEINEALKVNSTLIDGKTPALALKGDDETFRLRHALTMKQVKFMHDYESETAATKDLAEFVKSFIILYTFTNWISPLISHYQVITGLEFNESCQPLAQMFMRLNRDGISQFEFAKLFVSGVVNENPGIVTPEWLQEIETTLNDLISTELSLVDSLSIGENETSNVSFIAHHYKDQMLSLIGSFDGTKHVGDIQRGVEFVDVIRQITPKIDHSAGIGGFQW